MQITRSNLYFDTYVSVTLFEEDALKTEELFRGIWDLCDHYEHCFSATLEGSDIHRINSSNNTPTPVSEDTIQLLSYAKDLANRFQGVVDPSIGALKQLWNFNAPKDGWTPPDQASIQNALTHVNYQNIAIDEEHSTVTLLDAQMQLDLGFVAKGYISDAIAAWLKSQNVKHALINLGGNILCIGDKPSGARYTIGIQKPFAENGESIEVVTISDSSMVTSGVYERYQEYQQTIYSHILRTDTGYPVDNALLSVTILSPSSTDCDAYSTLVMLLGIEDGLSLVNATPSMECIIVTADEQIIKSDGLK